MRDDPLRTSVPSGQRRRALVAAACLAVVVQCLPSCKQQRDPEAQRDEMREQVRTRMEQIRDDPAKRAEFERKTRELKSGLEKFQRELRDAKRQIESLDRGGW